MIWEGYQQIKINSAQQAADLAHAKADRYAYDIATVLKKLDRLSLSCQAMWELLRDQTELTEKDIENKVLEIDGRDGHTDGKIATQMRTCQACGRPSNSKRTMCVICGADMEKEHKFEI